MLSCRFEEILDRLSAVVEYNPFHQVMVIVLIIVGLNKARNKLGAVMSRRNDGNNHYLGNIERRIKSHFKFICGFDGCGGYDGCDGCDDGRQLQERTDSVVV